MGMCAHCLYLDSYTYPLMLRVRGSVIVSAAAVLGFVLLLVSSTGAVVFDGPTDPITDDVALQPGDNPYAYLDENDELAIDVTEDNPRIDAEGINVDTLATQDPLFYITYDGNATAEAWIEHEGTGVTFVVDGEPVESPERAVRLTPADDAVPVGVRIDTRVAGVVPGDRLIDEISVHARPADPRAIESEANRDSEDGDERGDGDDDGPAVQVDSPAPDVREVAVESVAVNEPTAVDLDGLRVGGSAIRLDRLSFVRTRPGDVEFSVVGSAAAPGGTDPLNRPGVDPLGYYAVAFDDPDQPIESATAELVVDRDRLAAAGVGPDRLAVYREVDAGEGGGDGWAATEPSAVVERTEAVRITAESDGFSAFAVAAERPALAPVEATLSDGRVTAGEPLTVSFDVENVGPAPASDAEVRVETVSGKAITSDGAVVLDVDPGATATRSVTIRFDEPGEYDLVLAGEAVEGEAVLGSVTVTERGDGPDGDGAGADPSVGDEPGSADAGEEPRTELSDLDLADFAGLAALVAIVLATLFLVRRAPR